MKVAGVVLQVMGILIMAGCIIGAGSLVSEASTRITAVAIIAGGIVLCAFLYGVGEGFGLFENMAKDARQIVEALDVLVEENHVK